MYAKKSIVCEEGQSKPIADVNPYRRLVGRITLNAFPYANIEKNIVRFRTFSMKGSSNDEVPAGTAVGAIKEMAWHPHNHFS